MTETRSPDRTRTAGVDMRQDGMPRGQAPAPQQRGMPMTAVQRAAAERQHAKKSLLDAATEHRDSIERTLRVYGIPFDAFMVSLEVGLNQTMKGNEAFFEKVSVQSFLEAVIKAAHIGLLPDGKQGAIVNYGSEAAFMPMVEGFVEIIWKTGLVADMNHNVVCEGDDFDFQEGDSGYVRHRRSLTRAENAKVIGAWCVINLMTRSDARLIEVVDQVDLMKIAKVSRATKGPRVDWEREMHRKAPFRRIVKRMPKTERLNALIEIDDRHYDLKATGSAQEDRVPAVPRESLFSDKAAVRKPKEPPAIEPPKEEPMQQVATEPDGDGHPGLADAITAILHAEDASGLFGAVKAARELSPLNEDEIAWIDESEAAKRMELGLPDPKASAEDIDDTFQLTAVITSIVGPKVYEDAALWQADILSKLSSLEAQKAKAFVIANWRHIQDAEPHHPEEFGRIMKVLADRHLTPQGDQTNG